MTAKDRTKSLLQNLVLQVPPKAVNLFMDRKFGMFIRWGLYSILGYLFAIPVIIPGLQSSRKKTVDCKKMQKDVDKTWGII